MSAASRAATYRARRDAEIERLRRVGAAAEALVAAWRAGKETAGPLENLFRAVEPGSGKIHDLQGRLRAEAG